MKIITFLKVIFNLYKRNIKKNRLMVIFMIFTNLTLMLFFVFFASNEVLVDTLSSNYLEHLSVDVSLYESLPTNNELINVKTYRRPSIDYLNSMMKVIDNFTIRPDYSPLLREKNINILDKEVPNVLIIILGGGKKEIGINTTLYNELQNLVSVKDEEILFNFYLKTTLFIEEEIIIDYHTQFPISYIYDEPTYFSVPKLYISQTVIDATMGSIFIKPGLTLNNYLLNINDDHELSNYRYRCHFKDEEQKQKFMMVVKAVSNSERGIEVSGDYINKIDSFTALYDYLNILMKLFLAFVIIGSIVIYVVIAHTSLLTILRQMALFAILGASKNHLYDIYFLLIFLNFFLSLVSYLIGPFLMPFLSLILYKLLGVYVPLTLNYTMLFLMIGANFVLLFVLITVIFVINIRRPLLYLLIDD